MIVTCDNLSSVVHDTRVSLGLSQSALANRAQCSQRLISELEAGGTGASVAKIFAILQALNIQLEAFPASIDGKSEIEGLMQRVEQNLRSNGNSRPRKLKKNLKDFIREQN